MPDDVNMERGHMDVTQNPVEDASHDSQTSEGEIMSRMALAHDAAAPEQKRRASATDNPLVRAVARIPLPLGGKLLLGFAVVAALLALLAALGLVALSQSNSRGERLRSLQNTAAYAELLKGDAAQLNTLVGQRGGSGNATLLKRTTGGAGFLAVDNAVDQSWTQFSQDVQNPLIYGGSGLQNAGPHFVKKLQATLATFNAAWLQVYSVDATGGSFDTYLYNYNKASHLADRAQTLAAGLSEAINNKADELVAADHRGFDHSRSLLIGVGTGSLVLALLLGLLLSWSVVGPLRRTQGRLSEIAGGDFGAHVEVPNRDEIGALAADVNRMNDELGRLYGELETASRHKSDFLATMSHELRTPLNAIIGFSEVLREQMFGELNERQLAYVDDVIDAGQHLLLLINDVLDLAKIEAGRMELELSSVALPELLRSAVSMHAEQASRNGITLALTTEPGEIEITADERRMRQIVFNLLSNAVKFTPADGRVDVTARLDDGQVEIAVADTGPGIPRVDQETIFEEFEQTADGKKAEGTGLGLPLSRKLVELHGGRLWVESDLGKGSTFRFTLPAAT
jgi:signal transduction histidine kinase